MSKQLTFQSLMLTNGELQKGVRVWSWWTCFYKFLCHIKFLLLSIIFFSLKADNASLAQRLKDAEDELSNLENLLDKEEVLERLGELRNDINKKRSAVREPFNDKDDLGRALADLHGKYLDLMRDLEKERRKQVCNPFYRSKKNYKYPTLCTKR